MTLEDIIERFIGYEDRRLLHEVLLEFHLLKEQNKKIIMNQEELAQQLTDQGAKLDGLTTQVTKIGTETKGLQDAIALLNGEIGNQDTVSPALQAAADAVTAKLVTLTTAVQAVDDSVPDAPAAPVAGA